MNYEELTKKIKQLKNKEKKCYNDALNYRKQIRELEEKRKTCCSHVNSKIVTKSYGEPPRIPTFYWKEKVCTKCGKTLATSKEETTIKWIDKT